MKRLLLISSVLVVMMCNVVFAASNFSFAKIEWTDSPEQMKQKIEEWGVMGECTKLTGPSPATYAEIFYPANANLFKNSGEDEKIIKYLGEEQTIFMFAPYYTDI